MIRTARSSALDLVRYATDKHDSYYLAQYDHVVGERALEVRSVLELGVKDGESLRLWADYFPNAIIAGLDLAPPSEFAPHARIRLFEGAQQDAQVLDSIASQVAPDGFDLIIDDAAHIGRVAAASFWHLFPRHLRGGGVYSIEDWGTGYWSDWPDGGRVRTEARWRRWFGWDEGRIRSHDYGMVGFIKSLIDEQGAWDLTRQRVAGPSLARPSSFARLVIAAGIVFVVKRG